MTKQEPFDKFTQQYEDWFDINKFAYKSEIKAVRSLLPVKGKGIEIGVGSGRFATPLKIKFGIEPSVEMSKIARQRGVEVMTGVAEKLPLSKSQFNYVLMVTTVCFLDDMDKSFKEVHRILKPGGSFVVGFIDRESPVGKMYQRYKNESVFYKIAKFYSVAEVVEHLSIAGFGNFSFVQTIFHNLDEIKEIEPVREGYGEGSFVVIKAIKA